MASLIFTIKHLARVCTSVTAATQNNNTSLAPLWKNGLPRWLSGKESACQAKDAGDASSIPVSERFPGKGNSNPPQYPCLGNPTDRGAWWATVHEVERVRHDLETKPPSSKCIGKTQSPEGDKKMQGSFVQKQMYCEGSGQGHQLLCKWIGSPNSAVV